MFTHGLTRPAMDPALNTMAGCSSLYPGSLFFSTCVLTHSWGPLCRLHHSAASSWYLTDCPDCLARTSFGQKPTFCHAPGQVQAVYNLFQPWTEVSILEALGIRDRSRVKVTGFGHPHLGKRWSTDCCSQEFNQGIQDIATRKGSWKQWLEWREWVQEQILGWILQPPSRKGTE